MYKKQKKIEAYLLLLIKYAKSSKPKVKFSSSPQKVSNSNVAACSSSKLKLIFFFIF